MKIGSIEQEQFENEYPEHEGKFGDVGNVKMGIVDDSDEEAFGDLRDQIINAGKPTGNDDVVVPMHNAEKAIDFNTVEDPGIGEERKAQNEERPKGPS